MNAEDAIEMILAGATGIQVGTANFVNPLAMIEIIDGVEQYMKDYNFASMDELIGKVKLPNQSIKYKI